MLISAANFIGEINVPNTDTPAVAENLQLFINKYERRFLLQLLGVEVYELSVADHAKPINDRNPAFVSLLAHIDPVMVASYVYRFYKEDEMNLSSGIGNVKTKGENSIPASPIGKIVRAWNEMSDWVHDFQNVAWFKQWFVNNNHFGYTLLNYHYSTHFAPINSFGL